MSQHRSFVLAAAFASIALAATPVFADPKPAPVAMSSSTRQPDREPPVVVDHVAPAHHASDEAPVAPIARKAGFAELPVAYDATAGFGVHVSPDVLGGRFGFHRGGAPITDHAKFGFATVGTDQR